MNNLKNKIISSFIVFLGLVFADSADAERVELSPFSVSFGGGSASDIAEFVVGLYKFLVGIAGIAAVGMIVAGGVLYATSSVVNKKGEGLDMIKSAVIGIILLLGSYVIIITINPNLLKLGTLSLPKCPATSDGKEEDPGRNCLPKIVAPVVVLCTGVDGAIVTVPDPNDAAKQIQVPEEPGKNCKETATDCVEVFYAKDKNITTIEGVQKATGCDPGIVSVEGCKKKSLNIQYAGTEKITEMIVDSEVKKFCGSIETVVDDYCGNNPNCEFTKENSQVVSCTSEWYQYYDINYHISYELCSLASSGEQRRRRWPFYKKGDSPGTAECMVWSEEEYIAKDKDKPNEKEWVTTFGGKTPSEYVAC